MVLEDPNDKYAPDLRWPVFTRKSLAGFTRKLTLSLATAFMALAIPCTVGWLRPGPVPPPAIRDAPDGTMVVIVNSSFACPGCRLTNSTIESAVAHAHAQSQSKSIVVHRRVIVFADHSDTEAHRVAARCYLAAKRLGQADAMRQFLYRFEHLASPDALNQITQYAASLGLDTVAFAAELESEERDATIQAHLTEFDESNVPGIPSVWIGERLFYGPAAMPIAAAHLLESSNPRSTRD